MRTRPPRLAGSIVAIDAAMMPTAILPVELGPFVVRRFVDFARTESMICRAAA
jgi:hypothetical protein